MQMDANFWIWQVAIQAETWKTSPPKAADFEGRDLQVADFQRLPLHEIRV